MAFKMKGSPMYRNYPSSFKQTDDSNGDKNTKKTADFASYDDMINSDTYKRNLKKKKKINYTYWDTTSDYEGGPEYKVVQTASTGSV